MKNVTIKLCSSIFLLGLLLITGCASGPRFTAAPPPTSGKALIYVYRKSSGFGAAGYDLLYVNNNFIGEVCTGSYAACEVPTGTTIFSVTPKASLFIGMIPAALSNLDAGKYEKLRIEAESGKTYYINLYVAFMGHEMKLVDEAIGTEEISSLKLAKEE